MEYKLILLVVGINLLLNAIWWWGAKNIPKWLKSNVKSNHEPPLPTGSERIERIDERTFLFKGTPAKQGRVWPRERDPAQTDMPEEALDLDADPEVASPGKSA